MIKDILGAKDAGVKDEIIYKDQSAKTLENDVWESLKDSHGNVLTIFLKPVNEFLTNYRGYIVHDRLFEGERKISVAPISDIEIINAFQDVCKIQEDLGIDTENLSIESISSTSVRLFHQMQLRTLWTESQSEEDYEKILSTVKDLLHSGEYNKIYNTKNSQGTFLLFSDITTDSAMDFNKICHICNAIGYTYRMPAVCETDMKQMWKNEGENK